MHAIHTVGARSINFRGQPFDIVQDDTTSATAYASFALQLPEDDGNRLTGAANQVGEFLV